MGPDPMGDPDRTVAAGGPPVDATTHYKVCPRCGTPSQLHATECANAGCRRPFRTQFAGAPPAGPVERTVLVPPAPPAYPAGAVPPPGPGEPTVLAPPASAPGPPLYPSGPPADPRWDGPAAPASGYRPPTAALVLAFIGLVAGLVFVGFQILQALYPRPAITGPAPVVVGETEPTVPDLPADPALPASNAPAGPGESNMPVAAGPPSPPPAAVPSPAFPANAPGAGALPGMGALPGTGAPFPAESSGGANAPAGSPAPPVPGTTSAAPETAIPPSTLLSPGATFVGETRPTLPCGHAIGQTFVQPEDQIERAFCVSGDMFIRRGKRWVRP